jgi:hypothetical protein
MPPVKSLAQCSNLPPSQQCKLKGAHATGLVWRGPGDSEARWRCCFSSSVTLAQSSGGQAVPAPSALINVLPNTPSAMASPTTIPGGLYRLANGYLSCPDTLYLMSGQPNLRNCTYVKDVH